MPGIQFGSRGRALLLALALLLGAGLVVAPAPFATAREAKGEPKKKERRNLAAGEWAFKKLSKAHELLAEEKYDEARKLMDEMSRRKSLNPHEQALMWQTYAYIQSSK